MVTSATWGRRNLFAKDRWAELFIAVLYHYRGEAYLLHEFVLMPDHFHVLMTPSTNLEKAVQFIKGGFSYRAKKELGSNMEVWQKGFSDHRIRDGEDYQIHLHYIQQNPVRAGLCERQKDYRYSSGCPGYELDPVPQRLKPLAFSAAGGAPEGAPFQTRGDEAQGGEAGGNAPQRLKPLALSVANGAPEGAPFQTSASAGPEGASLQGRCDGKRR